MAREPGCRVVVLKLGGSVLPDLDAYHRHAAQLRDRRRREPRTRFVIVVSARAGETDALLSLARGIVADPDAAALDLLWSTGEVRSAATLALCLHGAGVRAVALDVQQTGLRREADATAGGQVRSGLAVDARPLRRALARHDVVIVPGFLARGADDAVVTLGRGGSDLTAVAVAAALGAARCELVKDVPGYFTGDPNRDAQAEHLPAIDYDRALRMARDGCELVQTQALATARRARLTLVVRAAHDSRQTTVSEVHDALRHAHHSLGAAVGA